MSVIHNRFSSYLWDLLDFLNSLCYNHTIKAHNTHSDKRRRAIICVISALYIGMAKEHLSIEIIAKVARLSTPETEKFIKEHSEE